MFLADNDTSWRLGLRLGLMVLMAAVVLAVYPYTPDPAGDIKYLMMAWGAMLLGMVLIVQVVLGGESLPKLTPLAAILGVWVLLSLVSGVLSDFPAYSLQHVRRIFVFGLLFLVARHVSRTPDQARNLTLALCLAMLLSSAYGVSQRLGYDPIPWELRQSEEYLRLPTTFGNPNLAAHTLILAIVAGIGLAWERGSRWIALPLLLLGWHFYSTDVRGGKVALMAALLLVCIFMTLKWKAGGENGIKPLRLAVMTVVLTVVFGVVCIMGVLIVNKVRTGSTLPLDTSLILRYHSLFGASKMISDNPVLGYGPGVYKIANPSYWTDYEQHWFATERRMNYHVHNDLFEAGVESGVVGSGLYIAFFLCLILQGLMLARLGKDGRDRRVGLMFAAMFVAFAVDGLFGFNSKVPVSGMLMFVMAGALDGVVAQTAGASLRVSSTPPRRWVLGVVLGFVAVIALWGILGETQLFRSQALLQQAKGAKHWKYLDQARSILAKAMGISPWDWEISRDAGLIEVDQERSNEALAIFQKTLVANPLDLVSMVSSGRAWLRLAVVYAEKGGVTAQGPGEDMKKALDAGRDAARRTLALCAPLPDAHEILARASFVEAYYRARQGGSPTELKPLWEEAITEFQNALIYGSRNRGQIYSLMAQAYFSLKDVPKTVSTMTSAAMADPAKEEVWRLYLRVAREFKQYDPLIKSLGNAIVKLEAEPDKTSPENVALLRLMLGMAYLEGRNDPASSLPLLKKVVEVFPGKLEAWGALFDATRGDWSVLREDMLRIAAAKPSGTLKPDAPGKQTRKPHNEALINDAIELLINPKQPGATWAAVTLRLGMSADERSRQSGAGSLRRDYDWLASALRKELDKQEIEPANRAKVLLNLGVVFRVTSNWAASDSSLAEAMLNLPADSQVPAMMQRADVLTRLNRHEEALKLARDASRLAPTDFNLRWMVAKKTVLAGRREDALAQYNVLLETPGLDGSARQRLTTERDSLVAAEGRK